MIRGTYIRTEAHREIQRQNALGQPCFWKGKKRPDLSLRFKGRKLSAETRAKLSLAAIGKKCEAVSESNRQRCGSKSQLWKGGITKKHLLLRSQEAYKLWREAVFKRDKYTCVQCGDSRGGNLQADHIKPFAYFPELRLEISNGRTLCKRCHKNTPTWGWGSYNSYGRLKECQQ